jgi:ribosomal-protein-alanine N-acetyltransferase
VAGPKQNEHKVTIRRARQSDAAAIARWRSMKEIRRYQPVLQMPPGEVRRRLRARERGSLEEERGHELMWIIEDDGTPAGWVTLTVQDWRHKTARIAYSLDPAHWGHGVARRGVAQVLDLAFGPGRMQRIDCDVMVDNEPSQRLLERLGFQQEGRLRSLAEMPGGRRDFFLYSILVDEWKASGG